MRELPFIVGFDLDMTLLDTRPGIKATFDALAVRTGTYIDSDLAITRLGPPITEELALWYPVSRVPAMLTEFRRLYPEHALSPTVPLPGMHGAIEAVRAHGGRVIIVTGKHRDNAKLHLEHAGVEADEVVGELWAAAKGTALRERGVSIYVGDHLGDISGARAADAHAVAVATGPCDAEQLRAAKADVVLSNLTEFPDWLDRYLEPAVTIPYGAGSAI